MVALWLCYWPWVLLGHATPMAACQAGGRGVPSARDGKWPAAAPGGLGWIGRIASRMNLQMWCLILSLVRVVRTREGRGGLPMGLPWGPPLSLCLKGTVLFLAPLTVSPMPYIKPVGATRDGGVVMVEGVTRGYHITQAQKGISPLPQEEGPSPGTTGRASCLLLLLQPLLLQSLIVPHLPLIVQRNWLKGPWLHYNPLLATSV